MPCYATALAALERLLYAPSLYDEFLRHLARARLPVPQGCLERDFTQPYLRHPDLIPVIRTIYDAPRRWWGAYDGCEKLVDIEEAFQLWRFRHMETLERIIDTRPAPVARRASHSSSGRSTRHSFPS
jgi:tryptophan 2,3-dioxygenase